LKRRMPALNALKAFEAAGTRGSFTRAAQQLNVTQSAVSRQVRQLEEQLGETLLERHHHRLDLTPAGRMLLGTLQHSFDRIELTVRAIQQKSNLNRLRVNVPPTFASRWLVPRLAQLHQRHPSLELSLTSRLQDSLTDSTALDCAIRFGDGEWEGLECSLMMHEKHIAVCAPALLAADLKRAKQKKGAEHRINLAAYPLLHVLSDDNQRYLTWRQWLDAARIEGVDTSGGYEFDLLDHAILAAIEGLGITIADRNMIGRELESGQLVPVLDVHVQGRQSYWFVTRTEQKTFGPLQVFRQWLQDEIATVR
jgi:LysR family transcriptional regulator, glycine cleavage system transcriptional activator